MRVKIFVGSDIQTIQKEINEFFKDVGDVNIKFIKQTESADQGGWGITISIFYEV